MSELISIVVPVYNVEQYLQKCIDSIINQSYINLEIILVDDGSTDRSGSICDDYQNIDERILTIHKQNGGLSDARNKGLEIASGELIAFVDSDDWLPNNHIQILYDALKNNNAQLAIGKRCIVHKHIHNQRQSRKTSEVILLNAEETLCRIFHYKLLTTAWGKLYRTSLFDNIKFPVGKWFEDLDTIYRIIVKCKIIAICDALYYYRVRPGSQQHSTFSERRLDEIEISVNLNNYIEENFPSLAVAVKSQLISSCFHVLRYLPIDVKYDRDRQYIISIIKKYRPIILKDRHARKKAWSACLLSYFGFWIFKYL
jgi:glycosyltransferase involved in cell wall biosynthesis